jgi:hypothetical protein
MPVYKDVDGRSRTYENVGISFSSRNCVSERRPRQSFGGRLRPRCGMSDNSSREVFTGSRARWLSAVQPPDN